MEKESPKTKILYYINNEDQVYPDKEKFFSHYDFIYIFSFDLTGNENLVFGFNLDSSWVFGVKDHNRHFAACNNGIITFNEFYNEKENFTKERRFALFKFLFSLRNSVNGLGINFSNIIDYQQKFLQISGLSNFQFIVQALNFEKSKSFLYNISYLRTIEGETKPINDISVIECKENIFGEQTVAFLALNEYLTKKCCN